MREFGRTHDASKRHVLAERNQMMLVVGGAQSARGIDRMEAVPQSARGGGIAVAAQRAGEQQAALGRCLGEPCRQVRVVADIVRHRRFRPDDMADRARRHGQGHAHMLFHRRLPRVGAPFQFLRNIGLDDQQFDALQCGWILHREAHRSADPYRRQLISFKNVMDKESGVRLVEVDDIGFDDTSDFKLKYMPEHPAANEEGYVKMPNVNTLLEMNDMREAQRSYEANLGMIEQSRSMVMRTIDLLRV